MNKLIFSLIFLSSSLLILPLKPMVAQSPLISQISYFTKAPRLINVMTTFNNVRVWSATYYFTIEIPEDAGNTLTAVKIRQREGSENIRFNLDKTVVFEGNHRNKGNPISIESVIQNPDTQAITIELKSPIPADTTFTIGLKPIRNPDYEGVYLFGVTVYPSGENPSELYLGPGRLHFYRGGDSIF